MTRLPNRIALVLLSCYRKSLGALFRGNCRFTPSCSEYAVEAFTRHSFLRALRLTVWRLLRCHPYCAGGSDPVP